MPTRRALLQTGAAGVIIVGAGSAAWALTRAPKSAREPWRAAEAGFGDARLDALAFAILAPNPHNMQPWRIKLEGEDSLTIFCNPARLLPETDPPNRQITIGFGCFLELLRQAAAEKGYRTVIAPFPLGMPEQLGSAPIARVQIVPDSTVSSDTLFPATLTRRTIRVPFEKRAIEQPTVDEVTRAGGETVSTRSAIGGPIIDEIKSLARDAWRIEWTLGRTRRESIAVTRVGKQDNNEKPWGISLAGPVFEGLKTVGVMTNAKMDNPQEVAYKETLRFYEKAIDSAAGFIWASTLTNTRIDQLDTGAAWVRMQQAATLAGLAFHPLSQALQEFPEMRGTYERAHQLLSVKQGSTVQMLARVGYAPPPPPAPREPLTAKLFNE